MNVAWGADGIDAEHSSPVADGSVPEDSTAHGPPLERPLEASMQGTSTTSRSQKARRSAVLAFEREMQQFSDQVRPTGQHLCGTNAACIRATADLIVPVCQPFTFQATGLAGW